MRGIVFACLLLSPKLRICSQLMLYYIYYYDLPLILIVKGKRERDCIVTRLTLNLNLELATCIHLLTQLHICGPTATSHIIVIRFINITFIKLLNG